MPRPKRKRRIEVDPEVFYFKPQGVPLRFLEEVELTLDELEAIRLSDLKKMKMKECAEKMKISTATFHRLTVSAHYKIAQALVNGMAIRIHSFVDVNYPRRRNRFRQRGR